MALQYYPSSTGNLLVVGLSTDTKPTSPTANWTFLESDTGKVYLAAGSAWGAVQPGANIVFKTADETVNNSLVLQDDNHLVFAAAASKNYLVEYHILHSGAANADFRVNWTLPTGAVLYFAPGWQGSTPYWDCFTAAGGTGASLFTTAADFTWGAGAATVQGIRLTCVLVMSTTAGNIQLRWAQGTAQASDSKFLIGSSVRYHTS